MGGCGILVGGGKVWRLQGFGDFGALEISGWAFGDLRVAGCVKDFGLPSNETDLGQQRQHVQKG